MKQDSRKRFFKSLIKKASKDEKVIFLTGDLGYNFVEEYQKLYPQRFINCGIQEQNMAGVATGLALMGWKPYIYSNSIFLNYKCIEQIRSAWMQGIDIKVVGTIHTGFLGDSHIFRSWEPQPLKLLAKNLKKTYIEL